MKNKYRISLLLTIMLVISLLLVSAPTIAQGNPNKQIDNTSVRVFIGFHGSSNAEVVSLVESLGGQVTAKYQLTPAIAAIIPASAESAISSNGAVSYLEHQGVLEIASVGEIGSVSIESHLDAQQEMPYGIERVNADDVWALGYTGQGVKVAVLDTGYDITHPDQPTNLRLDLSYDFVDEDPVPEDLDGHGTHTAGTVGAADNGIGVVGVAPGADIVIYRVCGIRFCFDEDVIQALEASILNDIDVVSMSFGGVGFWNPGNGAGTTTYKHMFQAAYSAGIVLVASAGNTPSVETGALHYPSGFAEVISVGATDINNQLANFSTFGGHQEIVAPGVNVLSTVPVGTGLETSLKELSPTPQDFHPNAMSFSALGDVTAEVTYAGLGGSPADFAGFPAGNIALIQRGSFSFNVKATNATAAGASGVIVFNNQPGNFNGTLGSPVPGAGPVVSLSDVEGQALLADVMAGSVTANLKIESSNYGFNSGTSMSAPHVSGVAALVLSANPSLTNGEVRNILTSTAVNLGVPGKRDIWYGWGLVDALSAVNAAVP